MAGQQHHQRGTAPHLRCSSEKGPRFCRPRRMASRCSSGMGPIGSPLMRPRRRCLLRRWVLLLLLPLPAGPSASASLEPGSKGHAPGGLTRRRGAATPPPGAELVGSAAPPALRASACPPSAAVRRPAASALPVSHGRNATLRVRRSEAGATGVAGPAGGGAGAPPAAALVSVVESAAVWRGKGGRERGGSRQALASHPRKALPPRPHPPCRAPLLPSQAAPQPPPRVAQAAGAAWRHATAPSERLGLPLGRQPTRAAWTCWQ